MCGRYSLASDSESVARYLGVDKMPVYRGPSYNIAPTQMTPIMTTGGLVNMRFGLVPPWARSLSTGYTMINAKSEEIFDKATYKNPIISQRCLVPASGFFEWQVRPDGKQPYYFHLTKRELFCFAGIFLVRRDSEDQELYSFAIITTSPNEVVADVHTRMPVILDRAEEREWLDPDLIEPERISGLMDPYPASEMSRYPVSRDVGNVRNNYPELLDRLS